MELRTVGELTKIPPVLEYLLDSVRGWPTTYTWPRVVGQKPGDCSMEKYWHLVNALEEAWTGVEESDRAVISKLDNHRVLIMVCLVRCAI